MFPVDVLCNSKVKEQLLTLILCWHCPPVVCYLHTHGENRKMLLSIKDIYIAVIVFNLLHVKRQNTNIWSTIALMQSKYWFLSNQKNITTPSYTVYISCQSHLCFQEVTWTCQPFCNRLSYLHIHTHTIFDHSEQKWKKYMKYASVLKIVSHIVHFSAMPTRYIQ